MHESRSQSGFQRFLKYIQKKDNLLLTHPKAGDIIAFADAPKGNKKSAKANKSTLIIE